MKIDVHCHLFLDGMLAEIERATGLRSLRDPAHGVVCTIRGLAVPLMTEAGCIETMDRAGVDTQVVSIRVAALYPEEDLAGDADKRYLLSRVANDHLAGLCRRHPGRFLALADIDLLDPDRGIDEMIRCLDSGGLHGVSLLTNVHGRPLDAPELTPFFAEADRRHAVVHLHPARPAGLAGLDDYHLYTAVGYPLDTTLAVTRLIFGGVMERFPNIRFILSHAGGALPYLWWRLDLGFVGDWSGCRTHISEPPSAYLRRLYYDTALSHRGALQLAYECVGDRLMLGTDYPYPFAPGDIARTLATIEALEVPPEVRRNLLGGHAAQLFQHKQRGS